MQQSLGSQGFGQDLGTELQTMSYIAELPLQSIFFLKKDPLPLFSIHHTQSLTKTIYNI